MRELSLQMKEQKSSKPFMLVSTLFFMLIGSNSTRKSLEKHSLNVILFTTYREVAAKLVMATVFNLCKVDIDLQNLMEHQL